MARQTGNKGEDESTATRVCVDIMRVPICVSLRETNWTDLGHSAISGRASEKLKPGQPLVCWKTSPCVTGRLPFVRRSDLLHILSQSFIFIRSAVVALDRTSSSGEGAHTYYSHVEK